MGEVARRPRSGVLVAKGSPRAGSGKELSMEQAEGLGSTVNLLTWWLWLAAGAGSVENL